MSYIRDLSDQIRGELANTQLPSAGLDDLFDIYAVLLLSKGRNVTNEDVHNAWSAWAMKYDADNESLVPYKELSVSKQLEDTPFVEAIKKVADSFNL